MTKEKPCLTCGRTITWRKKWEKCWDEVKYCSTRCRKHKPGPLDLQLEEAILQLLSKRSGNATICPSEAARAVFPDDEWRDKMEQIRQAARRLVVSGEIEILQKGRVVDPSTAKGPIRLGGKKR
jgi:hypothetical protein